jgi:serine protease Do
MSLNNFAEIYSEFYLSIQTRKTENVMYAKTFLTLSILIPICLSAGLSLGQIYKYQDATGNWHFTDSPDRVPKSAQTVKGLGPNASNTGDLKKQLFERFAPRNPLEEATLGTVTIKTSLGTGSGFFITEDGYIVTNKHVVRPDENIKKQASTHFEKVDRMADQIAQNLTNEEARLRAMQESLENLRRVAEAERRPSAKALLEQKYLNDRETLARMEQDFENRKKDFFDKKEIYEKEKSDYFWKTTRANRTQTFTIILKDSAEYNAYLAGMSQNNDIALLKIDGFKTPYLRSGKLEHVMQGEKVYAIGSPVGLKDSVSAGVISGFDGYYLRTDAKIYPGNSGGPLVNQSGEVIGINTLKEITHKFEGLGFAIQMDTAIQEFRSIAKIK